MRNILINALLLNANYSGVQYSIEYFIEALSRLSSKEFKFTVLISKNFKGKLIETSSLTLKRVPFDSSNRVKRVLYENFILPNLLVKGGFDLYHSPGYTLPYFSSIKSIITVHDLIALDFPELCQNETAIYFSAVLSQAIKKSTKIIAVSKKVKEDILQRFPQIGSEKIQVIYNGVHSRFKRVNDFEKLITIKRKYNLPDKYLFFVGNLEPKKNLVRIIEAFCKLKEHNRIEHKLIIAGQKGWKFSSIFKCVESVVWCNDICFLDYVDEDELPSLYSLAEVLVFPSLYEGFGLPVLEAMSCGCPVIVSNKGALPEISGGFCPEVNPYSVRDLALAIIAVIENQDLKNNLVEKGYVWSKSFTWKNTAEKTLELYETNYYRS